MTYFTAPSLELDTVRLEQLGSHHRDDLAVAVGEGELWRTWYTQIPSPDGMQDEIERRLGFFAEGQMVPWAVIDKPSGRAVGMSTFLNLDPENRRLEIGSTWLGRSVHGTAVNPAAKFLLLQRAFEDLGCIAVEFRTHWHNHQSRHAIEKLGAKLDGVLRSHKILPNGTVRDTVVYSIIASEWPTVKLALSERIGSISRWRS